MDLTCVIIDDNSFNIEVLVSMLNEGDFGMRVLGTATSGMEGIKIIQDVSPQVVFLDVEMPDMNGFEMLEKLVDIKFDIIFVTAHSQYSIKAIRFNAFDYLVKPIDKDELSAALTRIKKVNWDRDIQIRNALSNMKAKHDLDKALFLPSANGGSKIYLKDILFIEGDRNYSRFNLVGGKSQMSSKTLAYFDELLDDYMFCRCHRSYLVNRHHVSRLDKDVINLNDGSKITVSRRKKKDVISWLQLDMK